MKWLNQLTEWCCGETCATLALMAFFGAFVAAMLMSAYQVSVDHYEERRFHREVVQALLAQGQYDAASAVIRSSR